MRIVALILPILMATMMAEAMTPEEIQTEFDKADKDKDGCITKEEAAAIHAPISGVPKLEFEDVDKDGDGCIKLPEAKPYILKSKRRIIKI